jgi:hypothetical protein
VKTFLQYNWPVPATKTSPSSVYVLRIFDKVLSGGVRPCAVLRLARWTTRGKAVDVFSFQDGFASEYPPGVWKLAEINREGISVSGDFVPTAGTAVISDTDSAKLGPTGRSTLGGMLQDAVGGPKFRKNPRRKRKRSRARQT